MSILVSVDTSKDNVSPGERVPRSIRTQVPSSISQLDGRSSNSAGAHEITPFPAASIAGADVVNSSKTISTTELRCITRGFTLAF